MLEIASTGDADVEPALCMVGFIDFIAGGREENLHGAFGTVKKDGGDCVDGDMEACVSFVGAGTVPTEEIWIGSVSSADL
jgi:hypothetical protein